MSYALVVPRNVSMWSVCSFCLRFTTFKEIEDYEGRDEIGCGGRRTPEGFPAYWECGCKGEQKALSDWRKGGRKGGLSTGFVIFGCPSVMRWFKSP